APKIAIARTEGGRSIEQRLCFNFLAVPKQIESLGKIALREAGIELQRQIDSRERFVIPMRQAKSPTKYAMAKTIKVVERARKTRLLQRGFQPRRPILRFIDKGALHVHIAQCTVTARELRICRYRAFEISFGLIKPRSGKSP